MTENLSVAFREGDKLKGLKNYYVWALKMRAVLRAESLWSITKSQQIPTAYLVTIEGDAFTETQLKKKKALACRLILLAVSDDLVDMIAEHTNPAEAWKALKNQFESGDQSQILTLMGQLQSLKMHEGGSIEDYIKKARELKNRLGSMGEKLSDQNVNQIVLNGLPRSYESTIQTLTHLNATMTFEKLGTTLMSESHRREHRNQQLGDDEALATTHNRQTTQPQSQPKHQGRGRGWMQPYHGRGYLGRGFYRPPSYAPRPPFAPRPPIICYNCQKPGHFARDCRAPRTQ